MNLKRIIAKNEKGISPALLVLLMAAVTVAAALVTYTLILGYLRTTTARAEHVIQIQSESFNALDETSTTVNAQNAR
jgi:FlaG/FlaF family flagellin (archaellin)